jgi:hypothetical protein
MSGMYSDVLVLVAPHGSPTPKCSQYISTLREMGATIVFSQCYAEVSLTRNVAASAAYDVLQKCPDLKWVFWLDADMVGMPYALGTLRAIALSIAEYDSDGRAPTLSGAYVNRHDYRHDRVRLAAHATKDAEEIEIAIGGADWQLTMALCGMGCLLQSRQVFMQHCDESEHFCYPSEDHLVPEVCSAFRVHASELSEYIELQPGADRYYWQNEDFDYCVRELDRGRNVYLVNVPFGHEFMQVVYPTSQAVFPGLVPRERS